LGGGRALLMQVANPGVAAGVAEHSDFRKRPLHRLLGAPELTVGPPFGAREGGYATGRQVKRLPQQGRGARRPAPDPRPLLWVHAALIDSALVTFEAFVGPLSDVERQTYYQESKLLGGLLGLPNSTYPPSLADFNAYLKGVLAGDSLVVDARARELAQAVLRPPLRRVPNLTYWPLEAVTAGLLHWRLRAAYGLRAGRGERR